MSLLSKIGFSDAAQIEGNPDAQAQARAELRKGQRVRTAMNSSLPQIPREDLKRYQFGLLEHSDGSYYAVVKGDVDLDAGQASAYVVERDGDITFLEKPASGPKSRQELIEQQARRQERRNQKNPRPEWMRP